MRLLIIVGVLGAMSVFAATMELLADHAIVSGPAVVATERFMERN